MLLPFYVFYYPFLRIEPFVFKMNRDKMVFEIKWECVFILVSFLFLCCKILGLIGTNTLPQENECF
jgi:hypothetical protein